MNKRTVILSSLIILIPLLTGALLWNRLPERIPTHFNFAGEPDGWSGRPFAVFGLPLYLLAVHLVCLLAVWMDPKRRNVSGKIFGLVLWVCPVVSLFVGTVTYASALGVPVDVTLLGMLLLGGTFVLLGNYLPKCRQNYTVGIKLPWTLASEDNWNRTHRMAGPLWVAGGVVLLLNSFFRVYALTLGVLLVLILAPVGYSLYLWSRAKE